VALGPVLKHGALELGARKQLQHLAEDARYSHHGGGGPPYGSRSLNANRSRVLPPSRHGSESYLLTMVPSIVMVGSRYKNRISAPPFTTSIAHRMLKPCGNTRVTLPLQSEFTL
jgi:hypothetical protein